ISEIGAITFAAQLASRKPEIHKFVKNTKIMGACRDLVGPDVRMYHDQAVYKQIEKPRRFPWHQDNGYLFVEPQHYLTCWIALNDAIVLEGNAADGASTGNHTIASEPRGIAVLESSKIC
ncbi:MAG: phytanoyl-CoA dioxygenase family protein, partial [Actinomycetota bacterium]|nr:phytanoyl-CoA dioxygenase family protein [Actinomycetota bacterium]